MAGVAVNTPKIEQLTDTFAKWRTWKVHMQALLMERGLWTLVGQGTEIRPDVLVRGPGVSQAAVDARNTAIQGFDKKIAKATGLMVPTISGELFCFFTPGFLEDPRQLWIDLGNHFEAQSESHRLSLRTKLLHFQLREGGDPEEWVKERMRLYQQLTLSGNMVTDREQVLETLSLLPGSWQQFKNFLIFGDNGQLTMVSLVQKMTDWKLINKLQQKANLNGGKNSEHSYQVNTPKNSHTNAQSPSTASKPKKTFDKSRVKGYNCNEYGHFAKECPKPARKKVGASVAVGNVDDVKGRNVGGSADKDSREKTNMKRGDHNLDEKAFVTKKKKPQLVGTIPRTATADSQDGSSQLESSSFKSEQKSEVASEEVEEVLACTEKWKPTPILLDSGATNHMSLERDAFRDFVHFRKTKKILLADGYELQAHGQGDLVMTNGYLKSCFYVPDLMQTLWSVPKSTKSGYSILFDGRGVEVTDSSGEISATGKLRGNAYIMNCSLVDQSGKYTEEPGNGNESQPNCDYCKIQSCFIAADFETWHKRMGHLNVQSLRSLCSGKVVNDFSVKGPRELNFCEACAKGKAHIQPFPVKTKNRAMEILALLHIDLIGPLEVRSIGGNKYAMVIVDDASRYCWIQFLGKKSEAFTTFKEFLIEVENQTEKKCKTLRSDCGGEFCSKEFNDFLKSKGIQRQLATPEAKQQNGVAEWMNRTLAEAARTMLQDSRLPKTFWAEAFANACFTRNRSPSSALGNSTPYEKFFGKTPTVRHLRVFGCLAYAYMPKGQRRKLDPKAIKCVFIGYSLQQKAFRLYDVKTRKIITRRDVLFDETRKGYEGKQVESEEYDEDDNELESNKSDETDQYDQEPDESDESDRIQVSYHHTVYLANADPPDPKSWKEAMESAQSKGWKEAADKEIKSFEKHKVWELCPHPKDSETRSGSDRKRPPRRSRSRSRSPRRSGAKRSREDGNDQMVYISNIPYDVRWMEVKDLVHEKAGEVTYVEMLETPDGKSKGCAVVEFKDKDSAKKCVDDMHRMQLKDRYIVVKEIRDPVAFFRKVKEDVGVDFMANRSGPTVMESPGHGRSGMAYETYGFSPSFLRQLGIDGPLCCRVFVANLPYNVQSGKIHEVFSMAGKVVMVDLQLDKDGKSKGFAVVEYTHPIEAVQAVSMLNNQRLFDRSMSVKMDKYEKPQDPRRPGELPAGLKAVGMGLGTNGAPLTNVDQLISAVVPAAVQPAPQPLLSQLTGSNPGPTSLLSGSFGAGAHGAGGYGNLGSVGGGSQSQSMGSYGEFGGGGGGGSAFDGTDRYSGAPRSLMASEPYGTDRMRNEFDGPRREYDVAGRLSPLAARRSSHAVIIQNLPVDYTWQMVRDRLRGFGDIEFADIVQPGVAKVRFKTGMDAECTVSGLNRMSVEGRPITVDFGYSD